MKFILSILIVKIIAATGEEFGISNGTTARTDSEDISNYHEKNILSRRKRFIIFLMEVLSNWTHGYLQVGDIVWFGNTAALAWELPSDPSVFDMFRDNSKLYEGNRRSGEKHILYINENGRVIGKVPYHRKPIVNPAFAKRSVDGIGDTKVPSRKKMHDMQKNANYLNSLHEKSIEFHRSGRKSLYAKVEKVLDALGWDGKECILRMICEASRGKKAQGSFLEEIVRATFTLPKGREFAVDDHKLYDKAYRGDKHCGVLYRAVKICMDFSSMMTNKLISTKTWFYLNPNNR